MNTLAVTPAAGRGFLALWLGQMVSTLGSVMTSFAFGIAIFEKGHSVSELSSVVLAFSLPGVIFSPLIGSLLDRWDRRVVLACGGLGAAACTLAIWYVYTPAHVEIWKILICIGGISIFAAVGGPAVSALTVATVSRENYARANGLWQVTSGLAFIVSPLVAGLILSRVGFRAIVLVDVGTYLVAIASLAFVRIGTSAAAEDAPARGSPFSAGALLEGWHYIRRRSGLLQLLMFMTLVHLALDLVQILIVPQVLNHGNAARLAIVMAVSSAGMITGGIAMAISGGPKRRAMGVFGAALVFGGGLCLAGVGVAFAQVLAGMFILSVAIPVALSCTDAIWQTKVDVSRQGRVFAFKSMMAQLAQPAACALAPVACHLLTVHEPALSARLGVSWGAGAEPGLVLALAGAIIVVAAALALTRRSLRCIDTETPDTHAVTRAEVNHAPLSGQAAIGPAAIGQAAIGAAD
jgi:MFS family permease